MTRAAMIRRAGPFVVHPLANGDLRVMCSWPNEKRTVSGDMLGPGLMSRADLAQEVEQLLDAVMTRKRRKKR